MASLVPAMSATCEDQEYQHLGTVSLLAGIDLLTGKVHASVEDRHRSREFVGFLKQFSDHRQMIVALCQQIRLAGGDSRRALRDHHLDVVAMAAIVW